MSIITGSLNCHAMLQEMRIVMLRSKKHFLKGLHDGLQLQLMTVVYADYQTLVDRAIVTEKKRRRDGREEEKT